VTYLTHLLHVTGKFCPQKGSLSSGVRVNMQPQEFNSEFNDLEGNSEETGSNFLVLCSKQNLSSSPAVPIFIVPSIYNL